MPETTEAQKIHGYEDVLGKIAFEAPINDDPPINEGPKVDPSLSPYYEWGVENMRQSEFHGCVGENVEENSNDINEDEEKVYLDDNYDHLSQLRVNKKSIRYKVSKNYKL